MDPEQVVEHHSEHELEQGKRLKTEMDFEWQVPNTKTIPSLKPAKMYDPAEVTIWSSSPVISALSSDSAQNQPGFDANCPSYQTLPDCFDDTPMTGNEISQMLVYVDDVDEVPSEALFVQQSNLELPVVPPPTSFFESESSVYVSPSAYAEEAQDSNEEWAGEEEVTESFEKTRNWFQGLDQPTLTDMVEYEAAKLKEDARQKQAESKKAAEEHPLSEYEYTSDKSEDEHDDSVAEQDITLSSNDAPKKRRSMRKIRQPAALSATEKKRSQQYGLHMILSKLNKKKGGKRGQKHTADFFDPPAPKRKKSKKDSEEVNESLESILNTNFVQDANISSSLSPIPRFTQNNKDKALTELVAALPSAEQQKEGRSDKRKCILASKKFSSKIRLDKASNKWKLAGMKSALHHHQLLGASFMRERECCTRPPFGGLLCDTMGFGKTIQALANVVDGRYAHEDDFTDSTLIVVPAHLVGHWKKQIENHCEPEVYKKMIIYCGNARRFISDSPQALEMYNISITTYDEVRRSYPQAKDMPKEDDESKIAEWWSNIFEKEVGSLHQIRWNRIILDEGQFIQNHLSQTSIAVRALTGRFKWVLSGTPVQNYIHEFYPLFDFLGVPGIGTFGEFNLRYCVGEDARERLLNLLRSFMLRRTHASRLFSSPVVELPEIKELLVETEFCTAERAIYEAILDSLSINITGNPKMAQRHCVFAKILKLRMACSHILTVCALVKELLSGSLLETLDKIVKDCPSWDDPSIKIFQMLRGMAENTFPTQSNQGIESAEEVIPESYEDNPELVQKFHQFMKRLHEEKDWIERLARTSCLRCKVQPVNPLLTSCLHLCCEECYYLLDESEKNQNTSKLRRVCVECREEITAITSGVPVEDMDFENTPSAPVKQTKRKAQPKKKAKPRTPRNETDKVKQSDWIGVCAAQMPSAKLTKIRELITQWIAENPKVKIVIFTQFMDFVKILGIMCQTQGWPHAELTGKMRPLARFASVEKFNKQDEMRVFIVSLKAGGTGFDMPMASKCVLVDLWWNEAIADQALARIYRIGQENKVEFVKIIVKNTIDNHLLALQKEKTSNISDTMGEERLGNRASVNDLLRIFADVNNTKTEDYTRKGKQAVH